MHLWFLFYNCGPYCWKVSFFSDGIFWIRIWNWLAINKFMEEILSRWVKWEVRYPTIFLDIWIFKKEIIKYARSPKVQSYSIYFYLELCREAGGGGQGGKGACASPQVLGYQLTLFGPRGRGHITTAPPPISFWKMRRSCFEFLFCVWRNILSVLCASAIQ